MELLAAGLDGRGLSSQSKGITFLMSNRFPAIIDMTRTVSALVLSQA